MKRLSELRVGEIGVVSRLEGSAEVRRRLLAMGFVPGTEVRARRVAPMGDPVAFEIMGYRLSLRRDEAAQVLVEPVAVFSLAQAPSGRRLRVIAVRGGWGMSRRLNAMGMAEGAEFVKVSSDTSCPVAVRVDGSEHLVGRMMAMRVLVAASEEPERP